MPWSLTLGRIAGTAVRIHVTFLLLLAWIGYAAFQSGGSQAAVSGVVFIVLLFACVLAHEFGHITMARRFGIATPDVTLLPIGGVAALERMPTKPREQLLVALAGPAVNVVIAAVLLLWLWLAADTETLARGMSRVEDPNVSLIARLAAANVVLFVFNLIPAFPMDGGRVLNAVLAMRMDKNRALQISARIGQIMAFVFGFLGLANGAPLLVFIAIFIYLAASAEAQSGTLENMTSSLHVADAMETRFAVVPVDATIGDAVNILLATGQHEFPVVDAFRKPVGLLTRDALIAALRASGDAAPITQALAEAPPSLRRRDKLDDGVREMNRLRAPAISVVDEDGAVVGLLTMQNVAEMLMIRGANPEWTFKRAR
ncbi:MAG: site-2 protease family protein [Beijerinckiaceae bacterium]|nr:site-2 protease family protein [Beijerinckiaceae bacterium]